MLSIYGEVQKTLKVTLGQFKPVIGDKQGNLETMKEIMEQAASEDADLVLFPELCLSGYFIQDIKEEMAEPINGDSIKYIQALCKELQVYTVFSWPERGEDGKIYNSACLISDQGKIAGNYRKVHLYDREKEIFESGDTFKVFDTDLGRIGIMICYDLDFPEAARSLYAGGADIILIPTNNFYPYARYQEAYLKVRAMENELPIAICNRTGQEDDLNYFGESAAYDPFGHELIKLNETEKPGTVIIPLNKERDEKLQYWENRHPKAYHKLIK